MKFSIVSSFLVLAVVLCVVRSEIVPRFPGVQPIIIDGTVAPPTYYTDFEDKTTIDDFSFDTAPPVIIVLPGAGAPPSVQDFSYDRDPTIIGGERDVIFVAENGSANLVFSAGASGGVFTIATPNGGSGFALLQYDGLDQSTTLSTNPGLGGFDMTDGDAIGFRVLALTDIDTVFQITVVDNAGNTAIAQGEVIGSQGTGDLPQSYFIDFSIFPAVNFAAVNAIEFMVEAFENVDFNLDVFVTYGGQTFVTSDCIPGAILPCDFDYYRIQTLNDVQVGDYVKFYFNSTGETSNPGSQATFYVSSSPFTDLQTELQTNEHIVDTLGALPGPENYIYKCTDDCAIEIVWSKLQNTTYYLAVEGHGDGLALYSICYSYNSVPVFQLLDGVREPIFFDQRADYPVPDRVINYRYYVIDVPEVRFSPGTYLVVNVSRVEPFPGVTVRLMYESLPEAAFDTGILDNDPDINSEGEQVDNVIYPWCIDRSRQAGEPSYVHPVITDPRVPCECFTGIQLFGDGPLFQLTCELVVDPCRFKYGNWYVSVELPARAAPYNPLDLTGETNYTISATVVQPVINAITRNETVKGYLEPELCLHFDLEVPVRDVVPGESHLHVHLSNVRGGFVDVYVHQGLGATHDSLAGGREACVPANATCHTCDACNVIIEKCHFEPGTWFISVCVSYDSDAGVFEIFDYDRLPITFTLRANWVEDAIPTLLVAGIPASKYIGEALYDFYVIDVPPTIDTWLFVELYAKAEDTEVILSILHGALPGGECYARPDFYCMTGDPRELTWNTGTPTFYQDEPVQRESCSFMIQTCELEPGPLFFSVYGHHKGYAAYGDTTFYQVPVHYTLWADFDVALSLSSGVSYSETVFEKQYQHYYIRADQILQGSWLSVEITNVRHAIPQSVEAFVNYNYLAGNCPCYDHLYNCTGSAPFDQPSVQAGGIPHLSPDYSETTVTCCTIVVPASDFRPGVWYIAVLGITEDYFQYTTPIGYTLTATVHDAPTFYPLILGQTYNGEVPQWNHTLEYTNFRLGAQAIPLNDLVIKVTFVQNCEFLGKHDDQTDGIWLFVNKGSPATALGYDYACFAGIEGDSYCTIVIPHCEWVGDDYFVAVQGDYRATFTGRFTIRAFTDQIRDIALVDSVPYYDRVAEGRHKHYYIYTSAEEDQYLSIDIYTNSDQPNDFINAYLNKDSRAGSSPCFHHQAQCTVSTSCSWQLLACDLEPGRYYISVYGANFNFYDTSVEYTLTAAHHPVSTRLVNNQPVTGHLWNVGDIIHYEFDIDELILGEYLTFTVDNVKHGTVQVYGQYGFLAGRCPCFIWERTCEAFSPSNGVGGLNDWCEIRIPTCELTLGTYYFSVVATQIDTLEAPLFNTPVGFVVEAIVTTPRIITPVVALGRNILNIEYDERVNDGKYYHYRFQTTQEDFDNGYHVIVEITQVRDAALFVYYNPSAPSDSDPSCHLAQICTGGLGSGNECHWQLPYSLVRPIESPNQFHYITVEARTGRLVGAYSILIFKQLVPSIIANPLFSLDDPADDNIIVTSLSFPVGTEVNITHVPRQEPLGWAQFIRLPAASHTDTERGDLLEIFFYRVTNNVNENMDFRVYVHPNIPAGAHGCCPNDPTTLGSCEEAPTSNTADTTTSTLVASRARFDSFSQDIFSHVCDFSNVGSGEPANSVQVDPFFGQRCIVRVWPCEFNKYCNTTVDWLVSVIPVEATDPASPGPGLQYSVQWRTRNIRQLDNSLAVGTTDLTSYINTYVFTTEFNANLPYEVLSTSTESQGWRSFSIDWNIPNARLSIQTSFSSSSGEVYIYGGEFASDTTTCYDYVCGTDSAIDCAGAGRFIVTEACSEFDKAPAKYWITVRNTGPVGSILDVSFRIVSIVLPATIIIPSNPYIETPYISTSGASVFSGVFGVEGDNYDFYTISIDDDDIDDNQSWVVETFFDDNDISTVLSGGRLELYIRYGAEPGLYGANNLQSYYGDSPEGAHAWQYYCAFDAFSPVCVFQIPACALIRGHYYIAIRNPDFYLGTGTPVDLPDYTLVTYIDDPPLIVPIDTQTIGYSPFNELGLLQHYAFNVTVDNVDFDDRLDLSGYWTKYFRIQLDNIESTVAGVVGSVQVWVAYGGLAGPFSEHPCLRAFDSITCDTGACFVDVTPCEITDFIGSRKFVSGVYYVAVRQLIPSTYDILGRVYHNNYTVVPSTQVITGTGHRTGTTNTLYRWIVTDAELSADGDGDGNYRYVVDPTAGGDDDIPDNQYFTVNITATNDWVASETLNLEIWRDDCTRYSCSLLGPDSWCTIDAVGLAPCSSKSGRFFIRVENPFAVRFTLDFYHNETTIQTLADRQIITEIIFPYEYEEYYYEATQVGEGATLTVKVCAYCGDVQVFLRPDLPAGPSPDATGVDDSCTLDTCSVSAKDDTFLSESPACCYITLDTCEYQQRGYYIGVRGVATSYPSRNQHLYLAAKYNIQAYQTTINFTEIHSAGSCAELVDYYESWEESPRQYVIDLETVPMATDIRFSLRVPPEANPTGATVFLTINANSSVGYSAECNEHALTCTGTDGCFIQVPQCISTLVNGARYYIWADAPRGSEILVERYDHYVPIVHHNLHYSGTINGPHGNELFNTPYHPHTQYYRVNIIPPDATASYFEKFFLRFIISDVTHGIVSAYINTGNYPTDGSDSSGICRGYFGYVEGGCSSVDHTEDCHIDYTYADLLASADSFTGDLPKYLYLTISGVQQDCELHSIQYNFVIQSNWVITYFPVDSTHCGLVSPSQYNFHRLRPREVEYPQTSILNFRLEDISGGSPISFYVKDGYLPVINYHDGVFDNSNPSGDATVIEGSWICGYNDLYLSVYGDSILDVDYRLTVEKTKVRVKELFDDSIYYADDDDDDACPHPNDYYIFKTFHPRGHHDGSFFRVLVDSEFSTTVYVNKGTFAWENCHDVTGNNVPEISGTTSVNVYDFCDYHDGLYYVTVVSDGPYYIYTDVRDDAIDLTLGEVYRDTLEPGMYQVYNLEICKEWYEADDRLVIEITDVENGDVFGWIGLEHIGGPTATDVHGVSISDCAIDRAHAYYSGAESGYDFLLINPTELNPGTYRILIRAGISHSGSAPERNCQDISFRLFPYLIDYEIDPFMIIPNVPITDAVDFYTINRNIANHIPFANYYEFMPLMENEGYFEQISHAVVRLTNVQGGLLTMRILCGHLAIAEFAYINGNVQALTKNGLFDDIWRMQNGRYPFVYQNVLDTRVSPYDPECTGGADFCGTMSFDDHDHYRRDTSLAVWIPSPYYLWEDFFIAVEPVQQFYQDHSIQYDLVVKNTRDYILLQTDTNKLGSFSNDNWDYDFYYSISPEPTSMRWRVVITSGEGVLVTVRNHRAPRQATYVKEVWCDAAYFDRPWMCDIEIPTRAEHPGDIAYFVAVYGKNATYSIAFWRSRENCHDFTGSGRNEGLDFCAGLVPYTTWRWDHYHNLDHQAHCFFEQLYDHFRVQPCWSGVSTECNSTLQAFACYESFHRCDAQGFQVGTCRDACEAVVYECANWFESVNLEHYNCTSHRYLDSRAEVCTGSDTFSDFDYVHRTFVGDVPKELLYDSSTSSSANTLSFSVLAMLAAILFVLF